jgi:hypothetical protein
MTEKNIPEKSKRPSADKTRMTILNVSKVLFLRNGFNGTSIQEIAKVAKVNTNLIFHHFTNKEILWHKVRDSCLGDHIEEPCYDTTNGITLFKSILDYRFFIYTQNPEFSTMIKWESLASQEQDLVSKEFYSPLHWIPLIKSLQRKGFIKKNIQAKTIMLFIIFSSHAVFLQQVIPFNAKEAKDYKAMLLEMCCNQFLIRS